MTIEQLEQGLDRYGGNLTRWPAAERAAAEALVAGDRRAAEIAAAAARLETALAEAMRSIAVDTALIGRIAAGANGVAVHDVAVRPTGRLAALAGAAMVAFLATGYAAGLALPASQGEDAFAGLVFGNSTASETAADSESVL